MDDPASKSLRRSWWSIAASIAPAVVAVLTAYPLMNIGACFSWLTAWIALGLAAWAILCARRDTSLWEARPRRSSLAAALTLATSLLLACSLLNLRVMGLLREVSKSTISSANLLGIYQSYQIYAKDHGIYPPSPQDLVAKRTASCKQFVAPCDPKIIRESDPDRLTYSSYLFLPCGPYVGSDRDIIIGYEREPWSRRELRLLAPHLRWVLFADGQILQLDQAQFEEALKKDAARRKELESANGEHPIQLQPAR